MIATSYSLLLCHVIELSCVIYHWVSIIQLEINISKRFTNMELISFLMDMMGYFGYFWIPAIWIKSICKLSTLCSLVKHGCQMLPVSCQPFALLWSMVAEYYLLTVNPLLSYKAWLPNIISKLSILCSLMKRVCQMVSLSCQPYDHI